MAYVIQTVHYTSDEDIVLYPRGYSVCHLYIACRRLGNVTYFLFLSFLGGGTFLGEDGSSTRFQPSPLTTTCSLLLDIFVSL